MSSHCASAPDGSGNLAAQTEYDYDTNAVTQTSGAPQHDYTNYPYTNTLRGNVTLVKRLLTSTSTWLSTTNVYNDVGNLVHTTDPGGHTYDLSYTDNFTDGVNRNSQGFLTSVASPTTANGASHLEGKQYYWYTGLTAAVCGQNAPTPNLCSHSQGLPASDYASYTYDLMGRPATVTHGDGGVTNFTFNESSLPFSVSSNSAIDSAQSLVNTALIDGLGRVKQTQLNSDPDGADLVDTTYDAAGQKATVSNPYRYGITSTTDGTTSYDYDPLGRTVKVIPPDGSTSSNNVQTFYRGNSVTVADQAGKARRSYTDALGRLIEVDEPAAGSALPGSTATGATGSTTIQGFDQGTTIQIDDGEDCVIYDYDSGNCISWEHQYHYETTYDSGTLSVSTQGHTYSVSYGGNSAPANLASALANAINADSASPVTVTPTGAVLTFASKTTGVASDISAVASVTQTNPGQFPNSFDFGPRLVNLLGGADAIPSFPPSETVGTPYVTLYTYDTLDNLTCVEQHGTATGQTGCSAAPSNDSSSAWRIRRFTYDSLGRLVTAKNPESGAISYTYDSDGNVLTKYDARGITTTMTYDQLHRVLSKTYSDGTPTATYIYDVTTTDGPSSSVYPIGRLVEVKNSNAKEVDSYDTRGRIAAQWQCTPLNCGSSWFNLGYSYNYAGGLISESTPMGFTLTPAYDPAARLKSLTSSWSDAQHPANLLTVDAAAGYTPAGALAKMTYGNGLVETSTYNNRLQPTQLRSYNPSTNADILNLNYGFANSAGANNGNIVSFVSTATQIFMRTYTYDELNRLSTMSSPADASGCYGLSWTYDAWGNRLSQNNIGGTCGSPSYTLATNNRIIDPGFTHDIAGNMTHDASHAYTFDAENRIMTMDSSGASYVYDSSGKRVRKTAGGVATDYVYAFGSVIAEIQGST